MGFLDYLDDKTEQPIVETKMVLPKKKPKKIVETVEIEEEVMVDEQDYIITDMGGKISFTENVTLHRYAVWSDGKIVDMSNDLITLKETYGNLDIFSREHKVNESKKYSIKKKKIKKIVKDIDGKEINSEILEGVERATSILEGVPSMDSDDAQMTPLGDSGTQVITSTQNASGVANHASSLL